MFDLFFLELLFLGFFIFLFFVAMRQNRKRIAEGRLFHHRRMRGQLLNDLVIWLWKKIRERKKGK